MDQIKTGKFIGELRREKGMTQEELGEMLGVTNKTVSRWETGKYMPDIDMLKTLGELFGVSINELIYGERLSDGELREKADENILSIGGDSFSLKEKEHFWKRKWLREHRGLIGACMVVWIAALTFSCESGRGWLTTLCACAWIPGYIFLRNKMMIYVEDRVYK